MKKAYCHDILSVLDALDSGNSIKKGNMISIAYKKRSFYKFFFKEILIANYALFLLGLYEFFILTI